MSFLKSRILNISFKYKWIEYLLFVYLFLVFLSYIFSYSIDLDGMEFSFLFHLQVLKKYGTVYTNPDSFPYFICFYPPFYAAFMQKFCSIMQVNIFTDMHRALVWGRLISLILLFVNVRFIIKITQLFIQKKNKLYTSFFIAAIVIAHAFFFFQARQF
jgi:hypothetical protein